MHAMLYILHFLSHRTAKIFLFFILIMVCTFYAQASVAKPISLKKALQICKNLELFCERPGNIEGCQFSDVDTFLEKRSFIYNDEIGYYFKLIGHVEPEEDSSTDQMQSENAEDSEPRMAGENVLAILNHEFPYNNYRPGGKWPCYKSTIVVDSLHRSKNINEKWGLCYQLDGTLNVFQSFIILYPERALSKNEFNAVYKNIIKISSKLYTHDIQEKIQSLDALVKIKKRQGKDLRISLYYTETQKGNYQIVIVYNDADALPLHIKFAPYKKDASR